MSPGRSSVPQRRLDFQGYPVKQKWLRRFFYLVIVIIWLAVAAFPFLAFGIASQGELRFGNQSERQLRLFLVQEDAAQGIGVEWRRPYPNQPACTRTSVSYLLWEGEGQNTTYCQCVPAGPENPGECLP